MPRSSSKSRIWLTTAVRRVTQRSRTRCNDCISSCSSLLIGTKRMLGRPTASAIASASMESLVSVFTNGFTYCGGIKRTSWPCCWSAYSAALKARKADHPISWACETRLSYSGQFDAIRLVFLKYNCAIEENR